MITVDSCERYSVRTEQYNPEDFATSSDGVPESVPSRRVIRMFRHWNDDNPYFEYVGVGDPYTIVYVMNDAGKTIDTIR